MNRARNALLDDLINLLDLEALEVNLFRGESRDLGGKSVFGGQVLGQALVAAGRTVEDEIAHSLHAYFLRPGDMEAPIVYEVDRIRDGRSFVARRVQGIQHGRPIFSMIASFHKREEGLTHQTGMPDVPMPEELEDQRVLRQRWLDEQGQVPPRLAKAFTRGSALEFRPVKPWNPLNPQTHGPQQHIWFRAGGPMPADPTLHRCVLAYASDFNLLVTALLPHGVSFLQRNMVVASLDHALWLHRPVDVGDWLLYAMDAPCARGSRGFSRGQIFNRQGDLVASVAQESLMRQTEPDDGRG